MSLECPRRLYYAYDSEHYANQDVNDEFLKSLAEGGFQVGEFAKLCYRIEADNMVGMLDADDAIIQPQGYPSLPIESGRSWRKSVCEKAQFNTK